MNTLPLSPRRATPSQKAGTHRRRLARAFALAAAALLPWAASQAHGQTLPPVTHATSLVTLTEAGHLTLSTLGAPNITTQNITVTGIPAGHTLVAIDIRPQTQGLYGLTINPTSNLVTLVHIVLQTGVATVVGAEFGYSTNGVESMDLPAGDTWDIDFDPVEDRLRAVSSSGLNFRINPNTGTAVDGNNGLSQLVLLGTNPDATIRGAVTSVQATAYTNSYPGVPHTTTQYTLDATTNNLCIGYPPESGIQKDPVLLKVNGAELDFSAVSGFDIPHNVSASTVGSVASGSGYAILTVGGVAGFYKINLATGSATLVSSVAASRSLTLRPQLGVAYGLRSNLQSLLLFSPTDSSLGNFQYSIPSSSITYEETLVAVDVRPATGQLYALGVREATRSASLYVLDLKGGPATLVGAAGGIGFTNGSGSPVNLPHPQTGYDIDFDPVADQLRVVTSHGLNFRVEPTGAPVDGNLGGGPGSVAGTNPDAAFNGPVIGINALGYASASNTGAYGIDYRTTNLFILSPPHAGTLINPVTITDGSPFGLATQPMTGLDIYDETSLASPNADPTPTGYFNTIYNFGHGRLYRLDLTTGRAVLEKILPHDTLSGVALFSIPPRGPLGSPCLADAMVGENYGTLLDLQPGVTVTAKGLPPGLKLNPATGALTGRVTTAGLYYITFTAKDSTGALTTSYATLNVLGIPKNVVGIYTALVTGEETLNGNTGGRVDITLTTQGTYSVKLQQRSQTFSAAGNLTTFAGDMPRLNVTFKNGPTLQLGFYENEVTGELVQEEIQTSVNGWRKTYDKALNPADAESGYYTIALDTPPDSPAQAPFGTGFAAVSIGLDGTVKITGKTAEGSALTASAPLSFDDRILLYSPLHKKLGSVHGILSLYLDDTPPANSTITGSLQFTRPAAPGRLYPEAISTGLNVEGAYMARAATGNIVLGLPAPGEPASLLFTGAGVEDSATRPDLLSSVSYVLPKAILPAPGSTGNPARVSLTINPANGNITGAFTLQDGKVKRSVKYQGMIIRRLYTAVPPLGHGFFLLPQLPASSTSPILSGRVDLVR